MAQKPPEESKQNLLFENGKVLLKTNYFSEYVENDFIVYSSLNLKRDRTQVSGKLVANHGTVVGLIENLSTFGFLYLVLDFWQKQLLVSSDKALLNNKESVCSWEGKAIKFADMVFVHYSNLDPQEEAQFTFKFILYTREENFTLYAKTTRERDIWVEALCRGIEAKHT